MSRGRDEATVLAVDDLQEYLGLYEDRLGDRYDVRTAHGGEAALDALSADVDVVLLDREMPDMSGDDVLAAIRDAGYDCRVAMVTANEPDENVVGRGYDAYVRKPVSGDDLVAVVERLLSLSAYVAAVEALHEASERHATGDADAERVRELRDRADDIADGFDPRDYRVVFRDLE
ncbi:MULTISPECIES: response regulator [Halobacterium]|uniref:response regulator n=1 Tax=Halobacterium TaxID=2239 RepID=UPI0009ECC1E1|nr:MULTISPECIES: response regulator [Halobacterium]MCG1002682.1 response regulator [Halobacterium noricense]